MRIVVIGLALLLWPVAAHAKPDATGGHTSLGAGNFSCGEWKSDREQKGVKADELAVWLTGYITAYNARGAQGPETLPEALTSTVPSHGWMITAPRIR
jgi:hypothetical protein